MDIAARRGAHIDVGIFGLLLGRPGGADLQDHRSFGSALLPVMPIPQYSDAMQMRDALRVMQKIFSEKDCKQRVIRLYLAT